MVLQNCLDDPLQLWPTCVSVQGLHVDSSIECVHVCQCSGRCVCLRRTLCGCGECEKRGVLTALVWFQYSAGAGGVWVRIGSVKQWKESTEMGGWFFFQKHTCTVCATYVKIVTDIHGLISHNLVMPICTSVTMLCKSWSLSVFMFASQIGAKTLRTCSWCPKGAGQWQNPCDSDIGNDSPVVPSLMKSVAMVLSLKSVADIFIQITKT